MEKVNHSLKWVVFFVGLLASWLSFSGILPFFILPLVWLAAFVFLIVHKSYLRYFVVLFSSWVFLPLMTFVTTTQQYLEGKAVFYVEDLSGPEARNLDRKFRVWNEQKDPAVWGDEKLVTASNNFTVRFLVTIRGYQPGAYPGLYPDLTHAAEIIKTKGKTVPFEKPSTTIRLTLDTGVLEVSEPKSFGTDSLSTCRRARVWLVERELLLVQPLTNTGNPETLYLVDYKTRKAIAKYQDVEKATRPKEKVARRRKSR